MHVRMHFRKMSDGQGDSSSRISPESKTNDISQIRLDATRMFLSQVEAETEEDMEVVGEDAL